MHAVHLLATQARPEAWIAGGLIIAVILAFALLFLGALISILGSPLSGGMKLVWVIFAFCAPFLGSLLWFIVGKGNAYRQVRA
ncbi:Phospholipase_D-nuclease N-terminal [Amycolatopsis xylanica]|uniref:Phospholipase_D-nuclease N-terminal n=1 Tax=Amycolatopsis xylanica TaxID=589385 RepID=A0A1H3RY33_9PSEU|nr:PLDc N-terminal domain-containing protein [Amycolatopsis xylanica]SDZ30238.1 Phospholipase_D-nuclease N-terminal [Amycolatopsis xylanica]